MQRDRIWTATIAAALVALVAWSAWLHWQTLTVTPFPLGVDGYFYPIQLRSLLDTGALEYPASPLTFWWLAPFAAATDPITGTKLGAAIGCALVALPAYGIGAHLTQQRGAGLVAAAVASTASTSAYLASEFVKQGIGLTVALTAIWLVLRALASPTRPRIVGALVAIVATYLAHKLAAAIVLAIVLPGAVEELRARGELRGRRLLYLLAALGALVPLAIVLGVVAPNRFLSGSDLGLLGTLFSGTAHWDAPALVRPRLTLAFDHEALIAGGIAVVAAVLLVLRVGEQPRGGAKAIAWGVIGLGILIALPWLAVDDAQGLGFRLRVTAFVPLAIGAALVAAAAARLLDQRRTAARPGKSGTPDHRTASATPGNFEGWQRDAALLVLALVVARAPHTRTEGRVVPHPAMVAAVMAAATKIPANTTVIVPERHILFMTAWYTGAPVRLRPDTIPYGRRIRLMPLAFIGMGSPLEDTIDAARADRHVAEPPLGLHPRHRNGLVLVAEPTWDWLLATLPAEVRGYWAPWRTI